MSDGSQTSKVLLSRETANIIRAVFLPSNPRKMRKPHPDVLKAVQDFIAAVECKSNSGGTGLEQSPFGCDDGRGDSELTPGGAGGGRASGNPILADEPPAREATAVRHLDELFAGDDVQWVEIRKTEWLAAKRELIAHRHGLTAEQVSAARESLLDAVAERVRAAEPPSASDAILARNCLGNLFAAIQRFKGETLLADDADVQFAMREAAQFLGPPYTAVTKSDPFAAAPLTGPGSRLEAQLEEIKRDADETEGGRDV